MLWPGRDHASILGIRPDWASDFFKCASTTGDWASNWASNGSDLATRTVSEWAKSPVFTGTACRVEACHAEGRGFESLQPLSQKPRLADAALADAMAAVGLIREAPFLVEVALPVDGHGAGRPGHGLIGRMTVGRG